MCCSGSYTLQFMALAAAVLKPTQCPASAGSAQSLCRVFVQICTPQVAQKLSNSLRTVLTTK